MSETVTEDGGYLVQTDFATELLRRTYDTGVLTSRVRRLPIGANSNGITVNAVAETSRATGSRWGGVQVYWREEAGTVTNKQPAFRRMKLELNSLMGLCYATDELLADATAMSGVISQAFAEEFAFVLDDAIIRGSGNGQPLGILNSNAYVSVTKESGQLADTIYWENVLKMWSRLWSRSRTNCAWFVHQDTLPQLATMAQVVGVGGVPVYLPATGAAAQPYSTLFGRPVIEIEQADTVGDQGDIMLADLSQYVMIEKGGMESATSIHVRFLYAENTFRFILRTDGQPIWHSPLTLYNSSVTVAPFVVLDARA
jgi:HK97 family phage major capsid protein